MLALIIRLSQVRMDTDFDGDKLTPTVTADGNVWVNAEKIVDMVIIRDTTCTRIGLGRGDFAYVSESPEQVIELINAERSKLA